MKKGYAVISPDEVRKEITGRTEEDGFDSIAYINGSGFLRACEDRP